MTLQKLNQLSEALNRMLKSELMQLARKYNKVVKIEGLQKMKKKDLLLELLANYKVVHPIWAGETKVELPKRKGKGETKQAKTEDINKLIKEKNVLNKALLKSDGAERTALFKQVRELDKKISSIM